MSVSGRGITVVDIGGTHARERSARQRWLENRVDVLMPIRLDRGRKLTEGGLLLHADRQNTASLPKSRGQCIPATSQCRASSRANSEELAGGQLAVEVAHRESRIQKMLLAGRLADVCEGSVR